MTVEQYQALIGQRYLNDDGQIREIISVHIYVGKVVSAQIYTSGYRFESFSSDRLVNSWEKTV